MNDDEFLFHNVQRIYKDEFIRIDKITHDLFNVYYTLAYNNGQIYSEHLALYGPIEGYDNIVIKCHKIKFDYLKKFNEVVIEDLSKGE